jgi:ABC-type transport system substrate-binding protein
MKQNKRKAYFLAKVMFLAFLLVPILLLSVSANASETLTPQSGGKLNMIATSVPFLLPIPAIPAPAAVYLLPCVETLVGQSKDGVVPTKLATSWDLSADGKTLVFHLRKGVKFHDGTKFDAAAVKFNLDMEIGVRAEMASVSSVDIVDDYTIRLNLKHRDSLLLQQFAYVAGMIESPASFKAHDKAWFRNNAIGTGPFKLVKFDPPNSMVFQKFDEYWDAPKPYLDEFKYTFIADPVTAELAFRAGTAQAWDQMIPANLKSIANLSGYKVNTCPKTIMAALGDSVNPDSPFSKIQVRKALDHAIDKVSVVKTFGYNTWEAPNQCASSTQFGYIPNFQGRNYDPAKAKQLLAEAGYPNGFKTRLTVRNNFDMNVIGVYQANLKAIGIDAEIVPADTGTYRALNGKGWEGIFVNGLGIAGSVAKMLAADAPNPHWSVSALETKNFKKALAAAIVADKASELKANQALVKAVFDDAVIIPWNIDSVSCVYKDTVHIDINVVSLQWWNPGDTWISQSK